MSAVHTASQTLNITSRSVRAFAALVAGLHVYVAVTTIELVPSPLLSILGLAVFVVVTFWLAAPRRGRSAWFAVPACLALTALVDANLTLDNYSTFAAWHFGATALIGLFLAFRERFAIAWTTWAVCTAVSAVVLAGLGLGGLAIAATFVGHLGTVFVGTVFGIGIQRTSRRIAQLHEAEAGYSARIAREAAISDEQDRQTAYLEAVVAPALERIARPGPRSDAERAEWLSLESALRDSLRAPSLMVPEVIVAATAARARGTTVTLLDDSDSAPLEVAETRRIVAATVDVLDSATDAEVTVRVLPRGRAHLATILVRGGDAVGLTEID